MNAGTASIMQGTIKPDVTAKTEPAINAVPTIRVYPKFRVNHKRALSEISKLWVH